MCLIAQVEGVDPSSIRLEEEAISTQENAKFAASLLCRERFETTAMRQKRLERAKAKGIEAVVFDRGGYIFHGRVKALADSAREAGLKF